jgi:hypothetical protein
MSHEVEKDWITKAGLRAVVLVIGYHAERKSHRCGYVEIPEGHRLHGVSYGTPMLDIPKKAAEGATLGNKSPILAFTAGCGALDGETVRRSPDVVFDCHGGLTYSGGKDGYPVAESQGWWFGFDCNHCDDGQIDPDPRWGRYGVVRELPYVEAECERLAEQIVAMFPLESSPRTSSSGG